MVVLAQLYPKHGVQIEYILDVVVDDAEPGERRECILALRAMSVTEIRLTEV